MLLQRLTSDDDIGFNYDYMGAAEYEFGATRLARTAIAQAYMDGDIAAKTTNFVEVTGRNKAAAVRVVVLGRKDRIAEIGEVFEIPVTKEHFRTDNPRIVAWMNVGRRGVEPLLLVRADLEGIQERINTFFEPAIEDLRAQTTTSDDQ